MNLFDDSAHFIECPSLLGIGSDLLGILFNFSSRTLFRERLRYASLGRHIHTSDICDLLFVMHFIDVSFQSAPGAKAGATVRTREYFIFVVAPSLVMRYLDMPLDAYP